MVSIQRLPWKAHWIIASKMRWTPKFCRISAVPRRKSARLKACSVVLTQSSVCNEIDLVFFRTARFFCSFWRWGCVFPLPNQPICYESVISCKACCDQALSPEYGLFQLVSIKIGVQWCPNKQRFEKSLSESYHNDFSSLSLRSNVPLKNKVDSTAGNWWEQSWLQVITSLHTYCI